MKAFPSSKDEILPTNTIFTIRWGSYLTFSNEKVC